jgi:hypothetical protein
MHFETSIIETPWKTSGSTNSGSRALPAATSWSCLQILKEPPLLAKDRLLGGARGIRTAGPPVKRDGVFRDHSLLLPENQATPSREGPAVRIRLPPPASPTQHADQHRRFVLARGRSAPGTLAVAKSVSPDIGLDCQTPFPRSPTPAGGRCRTHKPADGPSAARPAARRSRNTQNRRANEARPSARCTARPSQTAPQTPEAQPFHPLPPIRAMLPKGEMVGKNI